MISKDLRIPINPVSHGKPNERMFLSFTPRITRSRNKNPRTNPLLVSSSALEAVAMMNPNQNQRMTTLSIIVSEDIDKIGIRVKSVNMINLLQGGCLKTMSIWRMNQGTCKKLTSKRLQDTDLKRLEEDIRSRNRLSKLARRTLKK